MGKYSGKTCKLISVMGLVVLYFFVELFIGFFIQSLALVADAFHMLSDFIALLVGIVAARLTKMPRTSRNTFGWQRADVVGTLINTVILSTLCFTIVVRAIERFIETHEVHQPILMVGVGSGGLLINIISLCILHQHGHSHGSHPHKYEEAIEVGEETSLVNQVEKPQNNGDIIVTSDMEKAGDPVNKMGASDNGEGMVVPTAEVVDNKCSRPVQKDSKHSHKESSMNMKAVLLHVMADAIGSVIVVISALIIYFFGPKSKWTVYVDPGMSLVLVAIIMTSTAKLLYQSALILLQSVPKNVKLSEIKKDIEKIVGNDKVHDLHIWRLQGDCIIGTVHIRCNDLDDYVTSSKEVKTVFHNSGIHCTTIQPEFNVQQGASSNGSIDMEECFIGCGTLEKCNQKTCCPTTTPTTTSLHPTGDLNSPVGNV